MFKKIKDSGTREEFVTGAVRDGETNKGRFDLLPASVLLQLGEIDIRAYIALAKHYENGAAKYSERNWEKGIPIHVYFNSAFRHCYKAPLQEDEPHYSAFAWNMVCMLWTIDRIVECELPDDLWQFPFEIENVDYTPDDTEMDGLRCLIHFLENGDTYRLVDATKFALQQEGLFNESR